MGIKGGFFNSHGSTADPRYDPAFPVIGPYVITIGPQQTTTALLYERNPYYWKVDTAGNQLPYIDFQEYTLYEDQDAVALAAANGQIDMEWRHLNAPKFRPLIVENRDKGDYRIIPTDFTYANEIAIKINLTHPDPVKREVFQNKNFRIGLSHAIDRQAIIDTVYSGVGEVANISPLRSSGCTPTRWRSSTPSTMSIWPTGTWTRRATRSATAAASGSGPTASRSASPSR